MFFASTELLLVSQVSITAPGGYFGREGHFNDQIVGLLRVNPSYFPDHFKIGGVWRLHHSCFFVAFH